MECAKRVYKVNQENLRFSYFAILAWSVFSSSRNLTWRDLQHIIAHSARAAPGGVWLEHGHWLENKAGFYVSKFYGFGLMDAGRMVTLAKNWTTVPLQLR